MTSSAGKRPSVADVAKAQRAKRQKRPAVFKQLKSAGYEVARVIIATDGSQIIEIAGAQPIATLTPLEEWRAKRRDADHT